MSLLIDLRNPFSITVWEDGEQKTIQKPPTQLMLRAANRIMELEASERGLIQTLLNLGMVFEDFEFRLDKCKAIIANLEHQLYEKENAIKTEESTQATPASADN